MKRGKDVVPPTKLTTGWKLLLGLQGCILLLAIVVLGLSGHILAASSDISPVTVADAGAVSGGANTVSRYLYPENLNTGPTWAITVTGIGGTIDAILILTVLSFGRPPATRFLQKRIIIPLFIILFVSVVRSLTAVSYGWSQDRSPIFDIEEWTSQDSNWAGWKMFTPYGWSKQAQVYAVEEWAKSRLAQICREVVATRALAVIVAVLDVAALTVGVLLWMAARGELRRKT